MTNHYEMEDSPEINADLSVELFEGSRQNLMHQRDDLTRIADRAYQAKKKLMAFFTEKDPKVADDIQKVWDAVEKGYDVVEKHAQMEINAHVAVVTTHRELKTLIYEFESLLTAISLGETSDPRLSSLVSRIKRQAENEHKDLFASLETAEIVDDINHRIKYYTGIDDFDIGCTLFNIITDEESAPPAVHQAYLNFVHAIAQAQGYTVETD